MNLRIKKLREESLNAPNVLSAERAVLVTDFYKSIIGKDISIPMQRALCFQYILQNKTLCINDGELIIGERGPAPKATPTYPEICLHSLEDLQILNDREKVFFQVDNETKEIYKTGIIPFWKGKTMREKLLSDMKAEWKGAYKAGVFTEFQEQRAPGHTVLGDKIYKFGMNDIIMQINKRLRTASDTEVEELKAMKITAETLITFAGRYADVLEEMAFMEDNKKRKTELNEMARICRKVPAEKPDTLHEALQYYWFVHLGVITELNPWDSFNPGRFDQHLLPYYKKGLENGTLDEDKVKELLCCLWIKFNNHPSPPKMGVTALESNTYTDFALINLGGLTTDGSNAVNEMSYLILDVIEEMRLLQPSSMVQISKQNPDEFIKRALKIIKSGFGQPSIFNTDAIIKELTRQGKAVVDARNGGASGCVESGAFGTECYVLSGYFNLPKILEITLNNGFDPRTKRIIGLKTGEADNFNDFSQLFTAFEKQLTHFSNIKLKGNDVIENLFATKLPVPFLSLLIDDCILNAKDYNSKGARYNSVYVQGVGLGTITDCLTSIKFNVFDEKKFSLKEMLKAVKNDYTGYEKLQNDLIYNTPKYGNDNDYADKNATEIFEIFFNSIDGRMSPLGATYRINMLPTTCHIYFGSVTGASTDGRNSGKPLSEGISPVQGADKLGPTAVLKSASKFDHTRTGGTLLNQKFSPDFFKTDKNLNKLTALIRSYFRMDTHHIQFNVIDKQTLLDAQKNPQDHQNLIVRVAGYSDYFNDLGVELQNEIIERTEHKNF
ncbi:MAG: glycyl radical protein [Candidatus Cloacimonetes bacterium]|jgi:trans-4-hydroxy-L-proline dehydratase|nr:glycyl radical protein [Candidatus Cloacimonadota bacterium]MBT6994707.1 glycyl radical protein [Candidatus Cloacimonadota bacterium]